MNLKTVRTGLPEGYASWADVPDELIPCETLEHIPPSGFVGGPLPFGWVIAATLCGNAKALSVLLAIKAQCDMRGEEWVVPPLGLLRALQVTAMGRSRALAALQRAGLIEVRRRKGRTSVVRLLRWEGESMIGGKRRGNSKGKRYGRARNPAAGID
jgi:hypothetical protein